MLKLTKGNISQVNSHQVLKKMSIEQKYIKKSILKKHNDCTKSSITPKNNSQLQKYYSNKIFLEKKLSSINISPKRNANTSTYFKTLNTNNNKENNKILTNTITSTNITLNKNKYISTVVHLGNKVKKLLTPPKENSNSKCISKNNTQNKKVNFNIEKKSNNYFYRIPIDSAYKKSINSERNFAKNNKLITISTKRKNIKGLGNNREKHNKILVRNKLNVTLMSPNKSNINNSNNLNDKSEKINFYNFSDLTISNNPNNQSNQNNGNGYKNNESKSNIIINTNSNGNSNSNTNKNYRNISSYLNNKKLSLSNRLTNEQINKKMSSIKGKETIDASNNTINNYYNKLFNEYPNNSNLSETRFFNNNDKSKLSVDQLSKFKTSQYKIKNSSNGKNEKSKTTSEININSYCNYSNSISHRHTYNKKIQLQVTKNKANYINESLVISKEKINVNNSKIIISPDNLKVNINKKISYSNNNSNVNLANISSSSIRAKKIKMPLPSTSNSNINYSLTAIKDNIKDNNNLNINHSNIQNVNSYANNFTINNSKYTLKNTNNTSTNIVHKKINNFLSRYSFGYDNKKKGENTEEASINSIKNKKTINNTSAKGSSNLIGYLRSFKSYRKISNSHNMTLNQIEEKNNNKSLKISNNIHKNISINTEYNQKNINDFKNKLDGPLKSIDAMTASNKKNSILNYSHDNFTSVKNTGLSKPTLMSNNILNSIICNNKKKLEIKVNRKFKGVKINFHKMNNINLYKNKKLNSSKHRNKCNDSSLNNISILKNFNDSVYTDSKSKNTKIIINPLNKNVLNKYKKYLTKNEIEEINNLQHTVFYTSLLKKRKLNNEYSYLIINNSFSYSSSINKLYAIYSINNLKKVQDSLQKFKEIYEKEINELNRNTINKIKNKIFDSDWDDSESNYKIKIGDHIDYRYEIEGILGKGTFGQSVMCYDHKLKKEVCIKIIKSYKKFYEQSLIEVKILEYIRKNDKLNSINIVKYYNNFTFRNHNCIIFELLDINLYEYLYQRNFEGLSLSTIRKYTIDLLFALLFLKVNQIIHCDLKPENILLSKNNKNIIKIIDFGSSCFEKEKLYSYIQSRFYRAPEILLDLGYSNEIDMWSLGCIICEMYAGIPIFPGENEYDQLSLIIEYLDFPPKYMIENSRKKLNYFDSSNNLLKIANSKGKVRVPKSKRINDFLEGASDDFIDLVSLCLKWKPEDRITPDKALLHPFIIGNMSKEQLNKHKQMIQQIKYKMFNINLNSSNYLFYNNNKVNLFNSTNNNSSIIKNSSVRKKANNYNHTDDSIKKCFSKKYNNEKYRKLNVDENIKIKKFSNSVCKRGKNHKDSLIINRKNNLNLFCNSTLTSRKYNDEISKSFNMKGNKELFLKK